jgi:nitrite reductase/ring-hydroxylating ferredoxin subunit
MKRLEQAGSTKVYACKAADVRPGDAVRIVEARHAPVAVFNVDGRFYATDDRCTHGEASLSDGFLEGCVVECPFHAGTFDVCTGQALTHPVTESLRTYPIRIEDGNVFVMLDE